MKLKLVRHLWGVDQQRGLEFFLPRWRDTGYEALEVSLQLVLDQPAFIRFLKQDRFGWIPQVYTNNFVPGGSVRGHLNSLKEQVNECLKYQPLFFNAHSGSDAWSSAEAEDFYGKALEFERQIGMTIAHETHRQRYFGNPWATRAILERFPKLKLTCDFSHWVCVAERLLNDCGEIIQLAAQHGHHLHARVGYEQGPQVSDPRAPEWSRHLAVHENWWNQIWMTQQKRGMKISTLTPEFGPPPYLHTLPYTQTPVADLADICDWMAGRQAAHFHELKFGLKRLQKTKEMATASLTNTKMMNIKNRKTIAALLAFAVLSTAVRAAEFDVATNGSNTNAGTSQAPFQTIQHAADAAQPGDVITVHEGIYRERVNPPRGGTSDAKRIVYQAAPGERVVITGSEMVKHWERVTNDTWKTVLPNSFFNGFNPYSDLIRGDWFSPRGRLHHTGAVYLNGDWLTEAAKVDEVLQPTGKTSLWFGEVSSNTTSIWAQFKGVNPNEQSVEINVRQTVFTPEKTGVNYITVRGFDLRDAATPWAPPTAGQIGIISAYWCKGWIIEDNKISYSACCGVTLGKYSDEWDNRAESAVGYVGTIQRALTNGWNKATVGSHIVRNNEISHCGQTGIVGSLGCSFSTITGNDIHDIHVGQSFSGAEIAGVKFHGAIDVTISHNHIYRCGGTGGLWLDWMAQGAQVTGNLFHDNSGDFFFEMQHGPILVANNLFLSKRVTLNSEGVAFVHNLFTGTIGNDRYDKRSTPFMLAHSTKLAGLYCATNGDSGDHRFYNNLFVAPFNLHSMDDSMLPCFATGNVFAGGAQPSRFDAAPVLAPDFNTSVTLTQKADGWYLTIAEDSAWRNEAKGKLVTTKLLGKAKVSGCAYENADGSRLRINADYFGEKRKQKYPFPGPFENVAAGPEKIKVWPLPTASAR